MIPMIMKLRVDGRSFRRRLWIPLILLWLLLPALLLILLPLIAIVRLVAAIRGWPIPLLRLLSLAADDGGAPHPSRFRRRIYDLPDLTRNRHSLECAYHV
jgi:hypothetical protein